MEAAGGARAGLPGRDPARLAWAILGCSLLLVLAGIGLRVLGPRAGAYPFWGEVVVIVVVLGTLGALVAARRPEHPVGWLFAGIGLAGACQLVAGNYAMAALADPALPAGAVAAVAAEQLRIAALGMLLAVMLLFPTGRPPSRRWWPVAWLGLAGVAGYLARTGLEPGHGEALLGYENPFGVTGMPWLLELVGGMEQLFYLAELAVIGSLVVRLWRARGVERQQLKWFVYTAVVALVLLVLANVFLYDLMENGPLGSILWGAAPVALAVAVAVAVLRYRLYEIDRLVNRTLVYGLLTGLLAGVYALGVFVLGDLLDPATGDSAPGRGRLHPGCGGPVPAGPAAGPGAGRPPLQPGQLRRVPDGGGVQRPDAGRGRPRHLIVRAAGGGRPDGAAGRGMAVAPARIGPAVTDSVTMPERWEGTTAPKEVP